MIRVFLVEDRCADRHGLYRRLEAQPDLRVVGVAGSAREALAAVADVGADVVVCDCELADMDGLSLAHRLLRIDPTLRVLIHSSLDQGPAPRRLIAAGALGYVSRSDEGGDKLLRAIRAVAAGRPYWDEVLGMHRPPADTPFDRLPVRTLQVAMLTLRGLTIAEVAQVAAMSESAVRTHRQRMFLKLGVRNDIGLLYLALEHGLVPAAG